MKSLRTTRWLLICTAVLLALLTNQVQAALDIDPLLEIMTQVPDSPMSRNWINHANPAAIEAAYPPAKAPANLDELPVPSADITGDPAHNTVGQWWSVFKNLHVPTQTFLALAKDVPATMGFGYFDIHQEIMYGQPPAPALQLTGDFDMDKVRKAFQASGFARSDRTDVELWCGPTGCDQDALPDPKGAQSANLFGSDLNRNGPLIIGQGYLTSTPNINFLKAHIATMGKQASSLADAPQYRAAIKAITQNGTLLQATFLDGSMLTDLANLDLSRPLVGRVADVKVFLNQFKDQHELATGH